MEIMTRMKNLIVTLNQAAKVYYQGQDEIMSNYDYDKLYDELHRLEEESGIILSGSPTVSVGYEILSELPEEAHITPMLSLDKTKEITDLEEFLQEKEGVLSLKLDGLSIILTYEGGILTKALTRGSGEVGEIVTNNAKTFRNLPRQIPYKGQLIIRGEALIRYSDFALLNEEIKEIGGKYKNPRNLSSGSVRQLNNEVTARRRVNCFLYQVIQTDYEKEMQERKEQMEWLQNLGFEVAPYRMATAKTIREAVGTFEKELVGTFEKGLVGTSDKELQINDLPSDGLVLSYNDLIYSRSLGHTAKFPRDSIAFKWKDELAETKLLEIEWSASRTGLINPVAVFEPVELEGTTVSRASVHNLSVLEGLKLGIGDTITVYKANMIIPQIRENITKSGNMTIPDTCPVCESRTERLNEKGSEVLICPNEYCDAKKIKRLAHFVSRNAINIDGLSESTLEKLVSAGMIKEPADLYHLDRFKEELVGMEGFGEKSYQNLFDSVQKSREVSLPRLVYSLGIKGIGLSMAKLICKEYPYDLPEMDSLTEEQLSAIPGVGNVLARNFIDYFRDEERKRQADNLWREVTVSKPTTESNKVLAGKTFVITGSLNHFASRDECKEKIENAGGKVTGSVSKNTDYLINNDSLSSTAKNKKAKQLEIPILTEEDFLELLEQ
ncbi:MAG: NAD-dependent DNA ligase LigA [Lachnoclostridium sp.]|jgi:DNA ligase (NAD+)|nr:NAD-dependent DNA ligase LigA [Lachnoclostridium sp.]